MPRALALPLRQQIIQRHQSGETLKQIAQTASLSYRSVLACWQRYRTQGEAGLQTHYDRCGPQGPKYPPEQVEAALALKRTHPGWGGPLVRLQLAQRFGGERVAGGRTIQSWWKAAGLQRPRAKPPPVPRERGQEPHDVWQIDAKERMGLGDGTGTCVLTVTDEASGALVGLVPFPPLPLGAGVRSGGAGGSEAPV